MTKLTKALAAGLALAASTGAAHAQAAACPTLTSLMTSSHAQVKALQGAQIESDADEITYTSNTQLPGMTGCKIEAKRTFDKFSGYWQHHLSCQVETANSEAANQAIEALWACSKDTFVEREPNDAWIGGRYRLIGFDAQVATAGRAAGLVDFGEDDFARVSIDKSYDTSNKYSLHVYWMFTK